jgi:hypothetical protein
MIFPRSSLRRMAGPPGDGGIPPLEKPQVVVHDPLPEGRIQENGVEKDLFWIIAVFEEARVRPLLLKKPVDVFHGFSRKAPVRGASKQLE